MSQYLEGAIVAFIVASLLWFVWRGGAANPEGTGAVARRVNALRAEVGSLSGRVDKVASEVKKLERESASTADIQRLEAKVDGKAELAERTWKSVDRIERFLIEKGLSK